MGSIAPFVEEKSKIEIPQKILAEKWAAFPPVLNRKIVKSKPCKKLSQKNGQHFRLFWTEKNLRQVRLSLSSSKSDNDG